MHSNATSDLKIAGASRATRLRIPDAKRIVWFLSAITTAWLVLIPILVLLGASVTSNEQGLPFSRGVNFDSYTQIFGSGVTYRLLGTSLIYTTGSVFLSLIVASTFSFFLQRTNVPFRKSMIVALVSPMAIPAAVTGMSWVLLASPSIGLYNILLRGMFGLTGRGPIDIYSIGGMICVTTFTIVPSFYLILSPVFNKLDPSLEEASTISGASRVRTLFKITLPLMMPALAGAALFYFILVIESFEIPAILGLPKQIYVFSTLIYDVIEPPGGRTPNFGMASTYGVLTLIITMILLYLYWRVIRDHGRFSVISGKAYQPRVIELGKVVRWITFGLLAAYLVLTVLVPFLVLVWASLLPFYMPPSFAALPRVSLSNYSQLVVYPGISQALYNTVKLVLVAATLNVLISAVASYMTVRGRFRGAAFPENMAMFIIAVPGIILALSLQMVYISFPLPIYGTVWIIVIACITRFLANGTRIMTPAYMQLHASLEEASAASGVSTWQTLRRIQLPMLTSAVFVTWLWTAVHSAREIPMSATLSNSESQTIAVVLWHIWTQSGNIGLAAALAVLLTLASAVATYFVARFLLISEKSET